MQRTLPVWPKAGCSTVSADPSAFFDHYTAMATRGRVFSFSLILQDIAKLSSGEEVLPRGRWHDSQTPRRLTALRSLGSGCSGSPTLPCEDRVAQCSQPLAFSTHRRPPLDACPLALRLFLNSKSQADKIEQQQQQKSLRTTYWICHRFHLLKCFQIPMRTSITMYSVRAVPTYQSILALTRCRVH